MEISRKSLYMIFKASTSRKLKDKLSDVEDKLREMTKCPPSKFYELSRDFKYFKSDLPEFWKECRNTEDRFEQKYKNWLDGSITVRIWRSTKSGRPQKAFQELSDRAKRRKTKELREQVPVEELTYAASVSQHTSGNASASKMIKVITASPTRAKKYKKLIKTAHSPKTAKHTTEEALSIFVEGGFTRSQWELLHETNKGVFPCYTLIREAKKDCYPEQESMRVTETCAEVLLQGLLDHTVTRLCRYLDEVLDTCSKEEMENLELITKWGCDGSHQTTFQQKFTGELNGDDSNIFQSSMVPLRLQSKIDDKIKILWQNPTPSSTRFCRPIRIRFLHESVDITKDEIKYIETQEKQLHKTAIEKSEAIMYIKHTLLPTMVDAKVCNAATSTTSTMRCYICGQTSKSFNNLNKGVENTEALRFGISILHARIRLFETVLHLAYKLPLKKWQARTTKEKNTVKENQRRIQKDYKDMTGLIIDKPKAGFGNSNSGNTSRRFFDDPDLASEITGINKDFIINLKIILEAMSSGYKIDLEKFEDFCDNTAKMYVELYGWHPMTPTLHKILVHGTTVIKYAILPIGQLSEEAAEARNKHYRSYRQDYARKFSREQCNQDVLNRLLLTSDPFISCKRKRSRSKVKPFSAAALNLLLDEDA